MANESMSELRERIAEVEARLEHERPELTAARRAAPILAKSAMSSRKAMSTAFIAAAIAGTLWALRRRTPLRHRHGN